MNSGGQTYVAAMMYVLPRHRQQSLHTLLMIIFARQHESRVAVLLGKRTPRTLFSNSNFVLGIAILESIPCLGLESLNNPQTTVPPVL